MSSDLGTSILSRTTKPVISFSVTRLQQDSLELAVSRRVLCDSDIVGVQRILDQITTPMSVHRFFDGGPVRIVLYADEAARGAKAVSAVRDAHSAHGTLNWVGARIKRAATLTVLHNRITGAVPYPHLVPEGENR